ncbi:hypothetical protein Tco_0503377 [Tanacetum coccineum]
MHEDFEYVESLEKEIDELESEKADFLNIYDLLLEECKSFNGQKQQRIDLNADALYNAKQENLRVWPRSSMFKRRLIAADQASVFMAMMFEQRSSSLVLHQMMSDHNSSDLAPQRQDMSVENVSSGLVPQGHKASDYDNSNRALRQNVVSYSRENRFVDNKGWNFSSSFTLSLIIIIHNNQSSLRREYVHAIDDDEDDGASRASTPYPTTYLNSLEPLDYQPYEIPTSSEQNNDLLFERQTDLLNQTQQMHKELRGGFKSFGKALRGVFGKKNK